MLIEIVHQRIDKMTRLLGSNFKLWPASDLPLSMTCVTMLCICNPSSVLSKRWPNR
jgi:hypothetical protein